ncbi:MAG: SWIM zinc finger family protein, partial [Acidimicrobiales bacterium]
ADPDDTDAPLWCSCRAGVFRAGEVVPCVHAAMVALHLGLDVADA